MASRGASAYPQIRFVALLESGTQVLTGAEMAGCRADETALAKQVIPRLQPGLLRLAGRYYPGCELWRKVHKTGADLLGRVRKSVRLDCERRLPDGFYLSRIYRSTADRVRQRKGIVVRVIEYPLEGIPGAEPLYRLMTTILDYRQAPAKELAPLYHERWEIGPLRSSRPDA